VSHFDPVLLQQLYRKGLVYLVIPIAPDDRFSIPPLEVREAGGGGEGVGGGGGWSWRWGGRGLKGGCGEGGGGGC
jgi:hypothetical protein